MESPLLQRFVSTAAPANATAHGEALAEELFRGDDPPDAIAAMSDELALGALRVFANWRF